MVSMTTHDPPQKNLKYFGHSLDIDALMNQLGHATIINAIIDRNREIIMQTS